MYGISLATILAVFAALTYNGAKAMEVFTVTSTSVPYESRFILKIDDFEIKEDVQFNYQSPILKSLSEYGMQWQLNLKPAHRYSVYRLILELHDLPDHVSNVLVSFNCSLAGKSIIHFGNVAKQLLTVGNSVELEFDNPGVKNFTFDCHVEGFLRQNEVEVTGHELDKNSLIDNKTLGCVEEIRIDTTREMITTDQKQTDVTLKANRKRIKAHKAILSKRLKNYDLLPEKLLSSHSAIDFTGELNGMELESFVSFLYYGKMVFPKRTCRKLYTVAKKYGSDCMEKYCEDKLSVQIDRNTASKILEYAELVKSDRLIEEATYCVTNRDSSKCIPVKSYNWW